MSSRETPPEAARDEQLEDLYARLSDSAARLMVVHEAGRIMRSTHDAEELAEGLLVTIAEALFAATGCVASMEAEELKVLATRGFSAEETEALTEDTREAAVWFAVADGAEARTGEELLGTLPEAPMEEKAEGDVAASGEESVGMEAEVEEPTAPSGFSKSPNFELYVPLRIEDQVLGVLALGRRVDRREYGPEDRDLAVALGSHLALALNSARLFAERNRRIDQLSVLLQISREITSTLDLDKVLRTIAHMLSLVLPNRRTIVGLVTGTTVSIRASSSPGFDVKAAGKDPLLPALKWAHGARLKVNTSLAALTADPEAEGRDVLLSVLNAEAGPRGLAVIPLEDEEGSLGLLAIESDADAAPLDDDSEELLGILANQTTVAIRNAELYQRVPMIGVLRPILGRGRLGGGAGRKKLALRLGGVAVVLTLAGVIPVPAWVPGDATIRPAELVPLRAATEGVISDILVKEGERVSTGAVVARLRNEEAAVTFEQVQAELSKARAEAARSRGHGDLASYQAKQTELAELVEREKYWRAELARAELTSPVNGVVLTPRVELQLGAKLARGERLLEMADLGALEAEVHVPQEEVNLLKPGSPARLKVHAYPSRTFKGRVTRVAPRADANRLFRVGVVLTNEDEALRPGMTGRAHIEVPPRPLLGTLLRPLVTWLRLKLWL